MPNTYKLVEFVLSLFKQLRLQRRLSPDTWLLLGKHRAILGHDNGHCRETRHRCHTAALEWHCYSNIESAARTAQSSLQWQSSPSSHLKEAVLFRKERTLYCVVIAPKWLCLQTTFTKYQAHKEIFQKTMLSP